MARHIRDVRLDGRLTHFDHLRHDGFIAADRFPAVFGFRIDGVLKLHLDIARAAHFVGDCGAPLLRQRSDRQHLHQHQQCHQQRHNSLFHPAQLSSHGHEIHIQWLPLPIGRGAQR